MELKGTVISVLELQSGQGKNGEWKKQEYVIEYNIESDYPKKMLFNLWGDKIAESNIQVGQEIKVVFDIDCREYNGRWYNDVKAWKIEQLGAQENNQKAENKSSFEQPSGESTDDLPF